ncbi:MAG: antibiotic biosynthesis monooxygenase [Roseitalea sp.]|nr:antibiotic biosynthesis monooxygenase [Roseitalea sp.]MBO6722056.1 antibiotic biosynthesis monooxygenase [Roseitalea sp.]MBO6741676.1 antibiotic biosynthesis monooxygenase [Roseitalea sp.]
MMVRIVWGNIRPGHWPAFKAAYKKACDMSANTPGMKGRWLSHDRFDENAFYSVTIWETEQHMLDYASSPLVRETLFPMVDEHFTGTYSMDVADVEFMDHFGSFVPPSGEKKAA